MVVATAPAVVRAVKVPVAVPQAVMAPGEVLVAAVVRYESAGTLHQLRRLVFTELCAAYLATRWAMSGSAESP